MINAEQARKETQRRNDEEQAKLNNVLKKQLPKIKEAVESHILSGISRGNCYVFLNPREAIDLSEWPDYLGRIQLKEIDKYVYLQTEQLLRPEGYHVKQIKAEWSYSPDEILISWERKDG